MNNLSATDTVTLDGVSKSFETVQAVKRMSLSIRRGSLFGLLGPNGAGKTTTLRMMLSVIIPDEGGVNVFGETDPSRAQDLIGYLPEERGLYPRMKVLDVLVFLAAIKGVKEAVARERARRWLERMEIGAWAERKVRDLSKGMQQKVQFIASVLHEPPLLILDEPFAGLDPVNAAVVKDLMLEMRRNGTTIILSSHRMEQVEMMCESICMINKGEKVLDGELRAIKKQYGKNTLRLEYEGPNDFLDQPDVIASVNHYGSMVEAKLRTGADPQEILKRAVERNVRINRFELVEPPLNEIFIEKVSGAHA